jgi:hypothetical protein
MDGCGWDTATVSLAEMCHLRRSLREDVASERGMVCVPSCSVKGWAPPPPLATWRLRKSLAAALVCTLLKSLLASDFILALVSFMRVGLPTHTHTTF